MPWIMEVAQKLICIMQNFKKNFPLFDQGKIFYSGLEKLWTNEKNKQDVRYIFLTIFPVHM